LNLKQTTDAASDLEKAKALNTSLAGLLAATLCLLLEPTHGLSQAVSTSADGTLRVWDLESGWSPRMLQGHTGRVSAVAVTPDGRHAISASVDHTLRVWNLENGEYRVGFTGEGPYLPLRRRIGWVDNCRK